MPSAFSRSAMNFPARWWNSAVDMVFWNGAETIISR